MTLVGKPLEIRGRCSSRGLASTRRGEYIRFRRLACGVNTRSTKVGTSNPLRLGEHPTPTSYSAATRTSPEIGPDGVHHGWVNAWREGLGWLAVMYTHRRVGSCIGQTASMPVQCARRLEGSGSTPGAAKSRDGSAASHTQALSGLRTPGSTREAFQ